MDVKTVEIAKAEKRRSRLWRWLGTAAGVCFVAWLALVIYVDWAIRQTPERFGRVMAHMPRPAFLILPFETLWTHERAGNLNPGDQAPDFSLRELQGGEAPVRLASLWNDRPVALVFGSYT